MYHKKNIFVAFFVLFVSVSVFSQSGDIGIIGTYTPLNPSFWSIGIMGEIPVIEQSNGNCVLIGSGLSFGKVSYEYKIPSWENGYLKTDYLNEDFYFDLFINFIYQMSLFNTIGFRLGIDFPILFSYAFAPPNYDDSSYSFYGMDTKPEFPRNFGFGISGIVGLSLFPKSKFSYKLDAYPGLVFFYCDGGNGFFIPIRFSVNIKI